MLFGHLAKMYESADARIQTAVKNDLSFHNLSAEDAVELALDRPLWRLLAAPQQALKWCKPNNDDDVP